MTEGKTLKDYAAEKFSDSVTICGITVEGVTHEKVNDFEVLEITAMMSDADADDNERLRAIMSFGPTVYGKKQWKRIKSELRAQNSGNLPNEVVMDFFAATLAAVNAKNS